MNKKYCIIQMVFLFLLSTSICSALPIGSFTFYDTTRTTGELDLSMNYRLSSGGVSFFSGVASNENDGSLYILNSGNNFDYLSAMLTNGVNDEISLFGIMSYGFFETYMFGNDPASINGIDFEGSDISFVSLLIDYSEWSDGYGDGRVELLLTITVDDGTTVPEPATMFLLGIGLVGLVGVKQKKIKTV